MYNFVAYLVYKTTTVTPKDCVYTKRIGPAFTESGPAFTERNGFYSYASSSPETGVTTDVNTFTLFNTNSTKITTTWSTTGYTTMSSVSENKWTGSSSLESFRIADDFRTADIFWRTESTSITGEYPKQKIPKQTTTESTYTARFYKTTNTDIQTTKWTTVLDGTLTVPSPTMTSLSDVGVVSYRTTLTHTRLTILATKDAPELEFVTWANWSVAQVVVADTVIVVTPGDRTRGSNSRNVLAVWQNNTGTESVGIHQLPYLSQDTTISWSPQPTIGTALTRTVFTTTSSRDGIITVTRDASNTTQTRTVTSFEYTNTTRETFTSTEKAFTCEGWATFTTISTTTNTSASGTISITSASLIPANTYEVYDEEYGESYIVAIGPHGISYQTGNATIQDLTTTQITRTVTDTKWDDSYETTTTLGFWDERYYLKSPQLKTFSQKFGFGINTTQLPWKTQNSSGAIEASSLDTNTQISSTTTISLRDKAIFYETVDEFRGSKTYFTSTGTIFLTTFTGFIRDDYGQQAWANVGTTNYAADDDFSYNTNPNRDGAALIFSMAGNQHKIPLQNLPTGSVVPKEIEPLIYPTFSLILSLNDCGFMAHPSVWSTITLSRIGKSISSTWQYQTNGSNTTANGTCEISTQSDFPYGVRAIDTAIIGGNMQPNNKISFFQGAGVLFTITGNAEGTASGFETISNFEIKETNASNITVQRRIPRIPQLPGYYTFTILDRGEI